MAGPGDLTTVDKVKRLEKIKELVEEGKTQKQIAEITGIPQITVHRNVKYLENLKVSDLTTKEIAEKRSELYVELLEATLEAKDLFLKYKRQEDALNTRRFWTAWVEAINARAKLYGLDNIKTDNLIQINQQNNYLQEEKVDAATGEKIANALKAAHETKVRAKLEE